MKSISIGGIYKIYEDTLQTYDALPAQIYSVRFSKMEGFYLEKHSDIEIKEEKIYGIHMDKVTKVFNSFNKVDRNLGVILSGKKGIGKSLFAKILSNKAVENGYPVIIVDSFIPGVASYIEEIDQECVVLFDEFDKTFGTVRASDGEADPQAGLLTLFDGLAQGKKLFIVTCNELRYLNEYLVNRPGRFHYHIRFEYPSPLEIKEYLRDKLEEKYYTEIEKVVMFSRKIDLNYDCLRAIAFEINTGLTFEEAIQDLNIVNIRREEYDVKLYFTTGEILDADSVYMDMFNSDDNSLYLYDSKGSEVVDVEFNTKNCLFDNKTYTYYLTPDVFKITYLNELSDEEMEKWKAKIPDHITINKKRDERLHYMI